MNKSLANLLAPLLLLAFVAAVSCEEPKEIQENVVPTDKLPVVEFSYKDHQVRVPYYAEADNANEVRLDFDRRAVKEVMDAAQDLMEKLIKKKRNVIIASGPAVGEIIRHVSRYHGEFKKFNREDKMPFAKKSYPSDMSMFLLKVLDSKYKEPKLSDDEVYDKVSLLFEAIQEVPVHSQVGMYVDWAKMSLDGVPVDAYSEPIVEWFNRSIGRRICLGGIKAIAMYLGKLS